MTRVISIIRGVQVTHYARPPCAFCDGLDCGPHPEEDGIRYHPQCAFADKCAVCGGGCLPDYAGQYQCRLDGWSAPPVRQRRRSHRAPRYDSTRTAHARRRSAQRAALRAFKAAS